MVLSCTGAEAGKDPCLSPKGLSTPCISDLPYKATDLVHVCIFDVPNMDRRPLSALDLVLFCVAEGTVKHSDFD